MANFLSFMGTMLTGTAQLPLPANPIVVDPAVETTAAATETVAETVAQTIAEVTEAVTTVAEETTIAASEPGIFSQLFSGETGFMGIWIILITALVVALITVGIFTLVLYRRRKKQLNNLLPEEMGSTQDLHLIEVGKLHEQGARQYQQDSFYVSPEDVQASHGVFAVVADGMGGMRDGDRVSQLAVKSAMDGFLINPGAAMEPLMWELLRRANLDVNAMLGEDNLRKSGSTVVMGLIRDGKFMYTSVGDSRICLWRNGVLTQLNREHDYAYELKLRTVNGIGTLREAVHHPKAGGLVSYLGMGEVKYVDMPQEPIDVLTGDTILLMTDGVYNALSHEELTACLVGTAEEMAQAIGARIAEKNYTQQDNYTAVVLKI